ncbi:hypothetical protein N7471_002041 [Penicillium samsonianum]|uniref:uncharacterized protein n=1 Tax=Penicillium samsonianum TaxID=1882272 RepID=UPI002547C142|nr:uncharacterized protein N7471_002041 [Penicillium samsonianum]KAJ6142588.1 hypothetical protein N7471_002041 [Penicillium samsonianum]
MSRTRQPMGSNSFQTTTESSQDSSTARIPTTLRLRAEEAPTDTSEATSSSRRIRWSEDVVDNEGMGKKSSKVCCIYHKARPVGESSSEESSSSSSESDSESEDDRRTARVNRARHTHSHGGREQHASHPGEGCCPEDHGSKPKRNRRKPSPNAYEKMPKPSKNQNQNQSQNHARGT